LAVGCDRSTHCTSIQTDVLVSEVSGGCRYGDVGAAVAVSTLPKPLGDDMLLVHLTGQSGGRAVSMDKKLPGKHCITHGFQLSCLLFCVRLMAGESAKSGTH